MTIAPRKSASSSKAAEPMDTETDEQASQAGSGSKASKSKQLPKNLRHPWQMVGSNWSFWFETGLGLGSGLGQGGLGLGLGLYNCDVIIVL